MGKKRGHHNPDHYQVDPGARVEPELYQAEQAKLKGEEREGTPATRGKPTKGSVIHAGRPLEHAVVAVCTECELEIGLEGGAPVIPCSNCGSDTFRVVS